MSTKPEPIFQRLKNKNLKIIEAKNTDTLLVSILLSLELEKRNNNELDNGGRILILSPNGFAGKTNTTITKFANEIIERKKIVLADKYSVKAEAITEMRNGIAGATDYWKKIKSMSDSVSTIIIAGILPFVTTDELEKNELDQKYKHTISLLMQYAKHNSKNILIVEGDDYSISTLKKHTLQENVYTLDTDLDNKVWIKETDNNKNEKLQLTSTTMDKIFSENTQANIQQLLYPKRRVTLANISNGSLRSLPLCSTGFYEIDRELNGGFELGQVVSIISNSEDIITHLTLQMAVQFPIYYKSLIFNLSMNPRRFKEVLSTKISLREGNYSKNNSERVQAITIDRLENDGDITEIIETIELFFREDDTRVFIIDNDSLLSNSARGNLSPTQETDSIYKKLQVIANKLDLLIIVLTTSSEELTNMVAKIPNSERAIDYAKTQIVITLNNKIYISKKLSQAKTMLENGSNILPTAEEKKKQLSHIQTDFL